MTTTETTRRSMDDDDDRRRGMGGWLVGNHGTISTMFVFVNFYWKWDLCSARTLAVDDHLSNYRSK